MLTTFYEAVHDNKIATVIELVQSQQVDVNYKFPQYDFKTSAHIAAARRDLTLLKTLVDLKADLDVEDEFHQVPIESAAGFHNYAAIKYLLTLKEEQADKVRDHINTKEVDEFYNAIEANDVDKVRKMLTDKIVDVDTPNKSDYNNTALHTACDNRMFEMAKMLVDEFHADLSAENNSEELPIHLTDRDEITEFLVSRGSVPLEE